MKVMEAQFSNWGTIRWKALTWAEYKQFQESMNTKGPMAVSNDIYRACIIIGPTIFEATAGIIEFVVKAAYSTNAFSGAYDVLNIKLQNSRNQLNENFLLSARAVIAGIFGYKFEEMDLWDENTFLERLAQAEFVAGKPLMMGIDQPINEEPVPVNQKPARRTRELTEAQRLVMERNAK